EQEAQDRRRSGVELGPGHWPEIDRRDQGAGSAQGRIEVLAAVLALAGHAADLLTAERARPVLAAVWTGGRGGAGAGSTGIDVEQVAIVVVLDAQPTGSGLAVEVGLGLLDRAPDVIRHRANRDGRLAPKHEVEEAALDLGLLHLAPPAQFRRWAIRASPARPAGACRRWRAGRQAAPVPRGPTA